jgi:anti-sigma regulatory factor (Ser/Thr protein kinase)
MRTVNDTAPGTKPPDVLTREEAACGTGTPAAGTFRPCRDYDPMFKLHGCELAAGHDGPHHDVLGNEWDERLPDEPGRCASHAPSGSGYPDQRCTLDAAHPGQHRDRSGNEWDEADAGPVSADAIIGSLAAVITRSFPGRPESVSAARSWVTGFLPGSPARDDAALMTSELVTNAVLHSASGVPGGAFMVSVCAGAGSVRVDVTDQGEVPQRASVRVGLGKGLVIVSQLADVFGADGADRWFWLRTDRCAGGAR